MNRKQRLAAYERERELLNKNNDLKAQVANLEAQLSLAFEIMTERQIAENQHLFQGHLDIGDSATNKKAEE